MTAPLPAERLAEMRQRAEQESYAADVLADDVLELLSEVDRLQSALVRVRSALDEVYRDDPLRTPDWWAAGDFVRAALDEDEGFRLR